MRGPAPQRQCSAASIVSRKGLRVSLVARSAGNNGSNPAASKHFSFDGGKGQKPVADAAVPQQLNLARESEKAARKTTAHPPGELIKTHGLHRAPLSAGVKTATGSLSQPYTYTGRYELPTPPVAVRNLVENARFGHLCTMMSGMHHRRAGYPFGTIIDFAVDGAGFPVFCLSPLAIHSRNLLEDPRCSFVVQMPGWTGLANARVTIFGDVYQLPAELQDTAREIFHGKHGNDRKERWISGNFVYFRMSKIVDIYFVGGFGTVQWIDPTEYLTSRPDDIVLDHPDQTLQMMNGLFADELKQLVSPSHPAEELVFISIDAAGVDIRMRSGTGEFNIERIGFDARVRSQTEAIDAVRRRIQAQKQQVRA